MYEWGSASPRVKKVMRSPAATRGSATMPVADSTTTTPGSNRPGWVRVPGKN